MLKVAQDRQREYDDKVQCRRCQSQLGPGCRGTRKRPQHQNGQFEEPHGDDHALCVVSHGLL